MIAKKPSQNFAYIYKLVSPGAGKPAGPIQNKNA